MSLLEGTSLCLQISLSGWSPCPGHYIIWYSLESCRSLWSQERPRQPLMQAFWYCWIINYIVIKSWWWCQLEVDFQAKPHSSLSDKLYVEFIERASEGREQETVRAWVKWPVFESYKYVKVFNNNWIWLHEIYYSFLQSWSLNEQWWCYVSNGF
jgi:hypothetical protein